ncbi:MAG: hypothetical protein HXX11_23490 [Desulfuromonadales bacterium]|nr:hypothetical protein [Desulfuromonadales bacterium]
MAFVHNVEIVWDELIDAFSSGQGNRVYFLDNHTGEIFFVPTSLEDEEFWRQMESNRERFLEIPRFDYSVERQIMNGFIGAVEDTGLKKILGSSINGRKAFGNINDILSFFPEEHARLKEIKDDFLTSRVKQWLEVNNLFTIDSISTSFSSI